jgi:hypothetical protein
MAERLTNEGANVEYVDTSNFMRLTSGGAMVEYVDANNNMRLSSVGIMVEYQQNASTGRVFGPALQMIGMGLQI